MVLGCPWVLCWDRKVLVTLVIGVVFAIFVKPGGSGFCGLKTPCNRRDTEETGFGS